MSRQQKGPQGRTQGPLIRPNCQSRDAVNVVKCERIRRIAKAMSTGAWSPILRMDWQSEWAISDATMDRDICEASRHVRRAIASDEELIDDLRTVARGRLALVADRIEESWDDAPKIAATLEKSAAEYLRILLTDTRGKGKGSQKEDERAMSIPVDELRVLLAASGYELRKVDDGEAESRGPSRRGESEGPEEDPS